MSDSEKQRYSIPAALRDEVVSTLIRQGVEFESGDTLKLTFRITKKAKAQQAIMKQANAQ